MRRAFAFAVALGLWTSSAGAQVISERGLADGTVFLFPQSATNDTVQVIGDGLVQEDVFLKPKPWIQFAGGVGLRANSHDQVDTDWTLDWEDRGVLRPRLSLRRLSATLSAGHLTVDVGKQFIRWARADVLNPIDRFAPRDFLNVPDPEFLGVTGIRPSLQIGSETFEAVWLPQLTPSRMPLLDQRWTVPPPEATGVTIRDAGSLFPKRGLYGARWTHTGGHLEVGLSYFDGFNHYPTLVTRLLPVSQPTVELTRVYPRLRTYGADIAIPTTAVTLKAEAAYLVSPTDQFDSYALYVVELERQTGEWLLNAGYAGEVTTGPIPSLSFDPERGLARSLVGRAAYTVDPRRTIVIEGALRQTLDGQYIKGEYSQAIGQHFRLTLTGVFLDGASDDFLGQWKRNSFVSPSLRFSF